MVEAVLAHEVADAAAGRDPADADRTGVAEAGREAVLAAALRVTRPRSGRCRPGRRLRRGVDVDRLEPAEVEDDAALASSCGRRRCGRRLRTASSSPVSRARRMTVWTSRMSASADDGGRDGGRRHHLPSRVVVGVGRAEHLARDGSADGIEVEGRGSGRNGHDRLLGMGARGSGLSTVYTGVDDIRCRDSSAAGWTTGVVMITLWNDYCK